MHDARIELLQRMPVFGGIRADVLQFLLGLCPVVSVATNEFFFPEHDQADSMFVLEAGTGARTVQESSTSFLIKGCPTGPIALGPPLTSGAFLQVRTFQKDAVFTDWYGQHMLMATGDHTSSNQSVRSTTNLRPTLIIVIA